MLFQFWLKIQWYNLPSFSLVHHRSNNCRIGRKSLKERKILRLVCIIVFFFKITWIFSAGKYKLICKTFWSESYDFFLKLCHCMSSGVSISMQIYVYIMILQWIWYKRKNRGVNMYVYIHIYLLCIKFMYFFTNINENYDRCIIVCQVITLPIIIMYHKS